MKRLALCALLIPLVCVGDPVSLTDEQQKRCDDEGGCIVFTRQEAAAMLRAQEEATMARARKACVWGGVGRDV